VNIPNVGDAVAFQMNSSGSVGRGVVTEGLDSDGELRVKLSEPFNNLSTGAYVYIHLSWVNDLDEADRTEFLFDITFNGDTSEFHGTLDHAKAIGRFLKECGFAGVAVTRTITEKVEL
jgi:hypothetical protein